MRTVVLILATLLGGCAFMQQQPLPDTRIPLDDFQVLRNVPRREVANYRCRNGQPLVAESVTGAWFDLRCDGIVRL